MLVNVCNVILISRIIPFLVNERRWSKISDYLPHRTDNDIKNRWNTRKKKERNLAKLVAVGKVPKKKVVRRVTTKKKTTTKAVGQAVGAKVPLDPPGIKYVMGVKGLQPVFQDPNEDLVPFAMSPPSPPSSHWLLDEYGMASLDTPPPKSKCRWSGFMNRSPSFGFHSPSEPLSLDDIICTPMSPLFRLPWESSATNDKRLL